MKRSGPLKRKTPMKRTGFKRVRADNGDARTTPMRRSAIKPKKRSAAETRRIYGTEARQDAVRAMPCAACGRVGYSVNAHLSILGMGIKDDASTIAPLCDYLPDGKGGTVRGCHFRQEGKRAEDADRALGLAPGSLLAAAARVEALYPTQ